MRQGLFSFDVLELPRLVNEVIGVSLGNKFALVWFLNKVLVALLLSKHDRVLLGLELEMSTLHVVSGRLPAYERVLPSMPFL